MANVFDEFKTIAEFLQTTQKEKILIPEYQRPYAWGFDQIEALFSDLKDFTIDKIKDKTQETYFLGTIVYFVNDNGEKEIIDGQQRLTSIMLLLRAIYEKLSTSEITTPEGLNFINKIEPLLFIKNEMTGQVDKDDILIRSDVVSDSQNHTFHQILKTGKTQNGAKDNYSKNYESFSKLYDEFISQNSDPKAIYYFINNLLNYTTIIPIKAKTQDTALTIFNTLNDRGMPLSDADIFKGKIYKNLDDDKKVKFIQEWKILENETELANEKMQNLFYMYMFYLRAKADDKDTTTPKLRSYLLKKKPEFLRDDDLLENLRQILKILKFSKDLKDIDDEVWSENLQIKQVFSLLVLTNNEWWKYPSIIYYLTHKNSPNFENLYLKFLRKLFVSIFQRYSIEHAINSIKAPVLKLNVEITNNAEPKFDFKEILGDEENILKGKIIAPHVNLRYALVLFVAYEMANQTEILPERWELEHIFPQKWQNTYIEQTLGWTDAKLKELLWNIGNLTPLEKKLNIMASNGYFDKKKTEYAKSKVAITNGIDKNYNEWKPENIIERNGEIVKFVKEKFNQWAQ
ncbi:DUF262 domain-containing HNH endonuclease family protein [Campylobacter sp. JMF_07 ED4]|uniref:DUF262 domain-containing protein n=1 Tax=Campylobacter sp. JMF_07 ED4 TaxID=2983840 RepID=UPI0022EA01B0|nr:DUF262 domain-containing HNH endonuclease family protein [Campylobacter sp. JMF_07 ED4]MDA3044039.1 DUF262 domain-containing HNH endonuclease family protein [Campylobacter sp. JMF_07 ED4]